VYQTLRGVLAAPLESLVLIDRFLFLSQPDVTKEKKQGKQEGAEVNPKP